LTHLDDSQSDTSLDSEDENHDNLPSYAPHVKADVGLNIQSSQGEGNEVLQNAAQNLSSELRRRGGPTDENVATATGNSLFPSKPTTTTGDASLDQTDAILSQNRTEQDALTTSLIDMAKQLKQQSIHFGQTLEGDQSVLDRAMSGLDHSSQGMEAAGQKMGTLRRMTEGKGWWDRMKLYAMIFGLWIFAYLFVFFGPKIRF
jgi:hypothetical protein